MIGRQLINVLIRQQNTIYKRKATAIVLVVVLVALLAIIGTSFVIISRIERKAAINQVRSYDMRIALDAVINYIQNTLEEDIWGELEEPQLNQIDDQNYQLLLGLPADAYGRHPYGIYYYPPFPTKVKNEPWDAPTTGGTATFYYFDPIEGIWKDRIINVDGDPWLASIDPSGHRTRLFSIRSAEADADGDGINDSYWEKIPVNAGGGEEYWAAVRIIDTSAMININTAWSWPFNPSDFRGNLISGIMLYRSGSAGPDLEIRGQIPGKSPLPSIEDLEDYQNNYIMKIEKPNWAILAAKMHNLFFDLSDELELRSSNDEVRTLLEYYLPNTDKRTFVTTYSFTRNIRRLDIDRPYYYGMYRVYNPQLVIKDIVGAIKDPNYINSLSTERKNAVKLFINTLKESFKKDATIADNADYYTWQYLVNLVDYLDDDDIPTIVDTSNTAYRDIGLSMIDEDLTLNEDNIIYGLEMHWVVSEVGILCKEYNETATPPFARYEVWIELFNPWGDANIPMPDRIEVKVEGDDSREFGVTQAGYYLFKGKELITIENPTEGCDLEFTVTTYRDIDDNIHIIEDRFKGTLNLSAGELSTTPTGNIKAAQSLQKDVSRIDRALVSDDGENIKYYKDADGNESSLGEVNDFESGKDYSAYVTSTTPDSITDKYIHREQNNEDDWDEINIGASRYRFAKVKTYYDIAGIPYKGVYNDISGTPKGPWSWLKDSEASFRFDFAGTSDNKAIYLRERLLETLRFIDRANNGEDDNDNGEVDDLDELRLAGLININTAPAEVIKALHMYVYDKADQIDNMSNKPYKTIADVASKLPAGTHDFFIKDLHGELPEKAAIWSNIANIITTRSDTFAAYILIGKLKEGENPSTNDVQAKQRWLVIFDRSSCNEPPVIWDNSISRWRANPYYIKPKIVAMQRIE